jgi:hypothetical protein
MLTSLPPPCIVPFDYAQGTSTTLRELISVVEGSYVNLTSSPLYCSLRLRSGNFDYAQGTDFGG